MKLNIVATFVPFVILVLCLASERRCETLLETPIVGLEMTKDGLHRDLIYTVQFDYPLAGKECEYVLEQRLPASVYISVDQLDDLKRLGQLDAIYPKFVDIETSTERAIPFSVLLRGAPKITDTLSLPIHFRYHAASDQSKFVVVELTLPTMYMHCAAEKQDWLGEEEDEESAQLQTTPNTKYCLSAHSSSFTNASPTPSTTHLNMDEEDDCNWRMINVEFQLKTPLRANIPVGNAAALPWVLYGTIGLSWLATGWLLWRTHSVPTRINRMLDEQRVLQQKIK